MNNTPRSKIVVERTTLIPAEPRSRIDLAFRVMEIVNEDIRRFAADATTVDTALRLSTLLVTFEKTLAETHDLVRLRADELVGAMR